MPLAGLVVNRVHRSPAPQLSAARSLAAAELLQPVPGNGDGPLDPAENGQRETGRRARNGPAGHDAGARQLHGTPATAATTSRHPLTATALRLHAERMQLAERERRLEESFSAAHPVIPMAEILAQPEDVHDLDGLRSVGKELARGVRLS
jgi:hypothetical protein